MDFMDYFMDAIKNFKVISIVGLAKNSGKTTVLNYIIQHLNTNWKLGITSIGRDGEPYDVITNLPKPLIFVKKGTITATADKTIDIEKMRVKTIKKTPYNTPLGNIKIFEIISDGYIELAGPSINTQLVSICREFENLNCDLILIDGAFDRKSYATPQISDGVILSTGASVSENMETVIEKTVNTVEVLTLPKEENKKIRELTRKIFQNAKVGFIQKSRNVLFFNINTLLGSEKEIIYKINQDTEYLVVKGAITDKLLNLLIKERRNKNKITILIEDASKLFVSSKIFSNFIKIGNKIKVMRAINLLAITINPTSPYGYKFNRSLFKQELKKKVKVPVFDVVME